jgi:DNA-binding Xre family transcriptional regulator
MISYKPLMKLMIEKDLTRAEICKKLNLSCTTLAKLSKGDYLSLRVIEQICLLLDCNIEDVVRIEKQ